jgi:hypothetical protein
MDIRPIVDISQTPPPMQETAPPAEASGSGGDSLPLLGGTVEIDMSGTGGDTPDMTRPAEPTRAQPAAERLDEGTARAEGEAHDARARSTSDVSGGAAGSRGEAAADGAAERAEPEMRDGFSRVTVVKEVASNGERKVLDRPVPQQVVDRILAGETVRTEITRTKEGGATSFVSDDSSIPKYATRVPVPKETPEEQSKFRTWVVLDCQKHSPKDQGEGDGQKAEGRQEPEGMDTQGFLARSTAPFRLVMEGRPVPADQVQPLRKFASRAYTDTSETEGKAGAAADYGSFRDELDQADEQGLVERKVVIGFATDDPAEALRLARLFASTVFKGDSVTWSPRIGADGAHASEQAALDAPDPPMPRNARGQTEPFTHKYVTGDRYAQALQYPGTNVRGLEVRRQMMLGADRNIPDGVDAVKVATIVDNEGQKGQDLEVPESHSLTVAETGAGKTEAIHKKVEELAVKNYEQGRKTAIIMVDMEKTGNNLRVSERLSGRGLPEDHATVNHIALGGSEHRININPLRACGNLSASDQLGICADVMGASLPPDAARVFVKFFKMGGERALEDVGTDPLTGKSRYPNGGQVSIDFEIVRNAMEKVINSSSFQDATKGDLGGFSVSQLKDYMRGSAAKLFRGGYELDIEAMVKNSWETGQKVSIDLGNIQDEQARQITGILLTEGVRAVCQQYKADMGITGDTSERLVHMFVDEANAIYGTDSPLARRMAASHKTVRGDGVVMDLYVQSPASLHNDVVTNSPNTTALRVTHGPDREVLASRMAGVSVDELNDLITAVPGTGLYYGPYMGDKPVRFEVPNPADAPRGQRFVNSMPTRMLDMRCDTEPYSPEVKGEAETFLRTTDVGQRLRAWVDMNATLIAFGERPGELTEPPDIPLDAELPDNYEPNLKEILADMSGVDGKVRDAALSLAIEQSFIGRKDLQWQGNLVEDYMKPLVEYSLPQVRGLPAPEFPDELRAKLAMDSGRFGPVRAELNAVGVLTAPRLPNSMRYERILGNIGGMTAEEQLDNVVKMEKATVVNVANVVVHQTVQSTIMGDKDDPAVQSNKPAVDAAIKNVLPEYHKLVGAGGEAAKINLYQRVAQAKGQPLTPAEIKVLSTIIEEAEKAPPPVPEADRVSYSDMDTALRAQQEQYKASGPIDLSKWESIYSDMFDREIKFDGATAAEQLRQVEQKARLLNARSRQRGRVLDADLVLAPDLSNRDTSIMEDVVDYFGRRDKPQGDVHARQAQMLGKGIDRSLPGLINAQVAKTPGATTRMGDWVNTLAKDVIYSPHFNLQPTAIRLLVMMIFKARQQMEGTAQAHKT